MISEVKALYQMNQGNPVKALEKACKEFEALFAQQLLKTMAESTPEGFLDKEFGNDMYRDMFYQEVARSIGESGALGIADVLTRYLKQHYGEDGKSRPQYCSPLK